ncbi:MULTISPECIES: MarR family winged helix-turn-helix transcriptional regulator [unclassified Curtobacterium]|uniref:MarR family winged helix-turn-helix transcriptional regulator n=1 Tax=unclassified Curtobacterium TaxID=257496 RepID=UPI0008DD306E|nr:MULTISPECIES: MarR family transcriptional regulator [unclassified Curtobacterium]OIH94176.1 hypothetical protein BIU92_07020 [Curtobacterium sp. MCBA15_003]OII29328.1 hypothetical protein BIU94_12980 [Curtobacterium sp. MMLR14_006]
MTHAAPQALRSLVSWQAGRVAVLGTRLTGQRMPLEARSDFAVLASLSEYGPLSQAEVGRLLGLDRNNVNGIVARLAESGFLHRSTDPSDRRRNILVISSSGSSYLADLERRADAVQQDLLIGLSADEQSSLVSLLGKVLDGHAPQPA